MTSGNNTSPPETKTGFSRPEVEIESRKYLSKKDKLELIIKQDGLCPKCSERLGPLTHVDFDHIIPLALGGTQDLSNWQALHKECHKQKTKQDVSRISRAKRLAKKRLGEVKVKKKIPSKKLESKSRWPSKKSKPQS